MTETGMVLSNPLTPASARVPGTVGAPLPGVETRLAPLEGDISFKASSSTRARSHRANGEGHPQDGFDPKSGPGELLVRGPGVFARYWNRPEATSAAFASDGFFRTGDAVLAADEEGDSWRVLGRVSADILKTGGFKVSALEVEAKLLEHPRVREVSVVGVPDDAYGEVGVAVAALESDGAERITKENDEEKKDDAPTPRRRRCARGRGSGWRSTRYARVHLRGSHPPERHGKSEQEKSARGAGPAERRGRVAVIYRIFDDHQPTSRASSLVSRVFLSSLLVRARATS